MANKTDDKLAIPNQPLSLPSPLPGLQPSTWMSRPAVSPSRLSSMHVGLLILFLIKSFDQSRCLTDPVKPGLFYKHLLH